MAHRVLGVDDILAMLLALSAKSEEIEVLMLSITYGNVEVQRYGYLTMASIRPLKLLKLFAECGCTLPCHRERVEMEESSWTARGF